MDSPTTCQPSIFMKLQRIRSDQISRSAMSDSSQPHESQHARPPCPSPTPGVHWDSRPSSQWCYPATSSSAVPFCSYIKILIWKTIWRNSQGLGGWGGKGGRVGRGGTVTGTAMHWWHTAPNHTSTLLIMASFLLQNLCFSQYPKAYSPNFSV